MEWNSNAPMELLAHMPARLTKANLEAIQSVIDNDKIICSTMLNKDMCGIYAPFCVLCDRSMNTPCAVAYIRMKQAEGIKLEIATADEQISENIKDNLVDGSPTDTENAVEAQVEVFEMPDIEIIDIFDECEPEQSKKRIRIATAKRKLNK